jgi:hypothetical protein
MVEFKGALINAQQAHGVFQELWVMLKAGLMAGHQYQIEIKGDTRTQAQNRLMWAMLNDVARQVDWHGQKLSPEDWKNVFSASLTRQRVVPALDGGFVVLGKSTSKMTKPEMTELCELIQAFGSERGVKFTAPEAQYET